MSFNICSYLFNTSCCFARRTWDAYNSIPYHVRIVKDKLRNIFAKGICCIRSRDTCIQKWIDGDKEISLIRNRNTIKIQVMNRIFNRSLYEHSQTLPAASVEQFISQTINKGEPVFNVGGHVQFRRYKVHYTWILERDKEIRLAESSNGELMCLIVSKSSKKMRKIKLPSLPGHSIAQQVKAYIKAQPILNRNGTIDFVKPVICHHRWDVENGKSVTLLQQSGQGLAWRIDDRQNRSSSLNSIPAFWPINDPFWDLNLKIEYAKNTRLELEDKAFFMEKSGTCGYRVREFPLPPHTWESGTKRIHLVSGSSDKMNQVIVDRQENRTHEIAAPLQGVPTEIRTSKISESVLRNVGGVFSHHLRHHTWDFGNQQFELNETLGENQYIGRVQETRQNSSGQTYRSAQNCTVARYPFRHISPKDHAQYLSMVRPQLFFGNIELIPEHPLYTLVFLNQDTLQVLDGASGQQRLRFFSSEDRLSSDIPYQGRLADFYKNAPVAMNAHTKQVQCIDMTSHLFHRSLVDNGLGVMILDNGLYFLVNKTDRYTRALGAIAQNDLPSFRNHETIVGDSGVEFVAVQQRWVYHDDERNLDHEVKLIKKSGKLFFKILSSEFSGVPRIQYLPCDGTIAGESWDQSSMNEQNRLGSLMGRDIQGMRYDIHGNVGQILFSRHPMPNFRPLSIVEDLLVPATVSFGRGVRNVFLVRPNPNSMVDDKLSDLIRKGTSVYRMLVPIRSLVDGQTILTDDRWCVTFVNNGEKKHSDPTTWGGHAQLLIEGVENGNRFIKFAAISKPGFQFLGEVKMSDLDLQEKGTPKIVTRGKTWQRSKTEVSRMLSAIEFEKKKQKTSPNRFFILGRHSIISRALTTISGTPHDNCATWAAQKLRFANVELPETNTSLIVTAPIQYAPIPGPYQKGKK